VKLGDDRLFGYIIFAQKSIPLLENKVMLPSLQFHWQSLFSFISFDIT
jgi:hypothetical protein